jgi:EF-P beta-lysylation protein EpmB
MIYRPILWKQSLQNVVRTVSELLKLLNLSIDDIDCDPSFPLRVPREFIAKMTMGDPNDPLLRQVLPLQEENRPVAGYTTDPVGERAANPVPGLLHKFPSRVLLTPTGACAVHCRYCFRRHFPYQENTPSRFQWDKSLDYVRQDPNIREVILSGGDPLSLQDAALGQLVSLIAAIPHVQLLRFHTRFPVMIPSRITPELLQNIRCHLPTTVVLHINHPNEIDEALKEAVQCLKQAGILVLNQSGLLKGVNDSAPILIELSYKLFETGILPYYVNCLDKVAGAHHFDLPLSTARALMKAQQEALPGYLMPRWMIEVPGKMSKIPLQAFL